jgi:gluconolactonase
VPQFINSLEEILARGAKVEKVLGGFQFTEGPVFSRLGFLLFSDIPANRIYKYIPGEAEAAVFREKSNGANGLTFDHQGRLLACEGTAGRVTRTEKDGKITVLADKLNAPNDLVYAIDGSIYFTDLRRRDAPAEAPPNAIYQITRKGEVRRAAADMGRANGVALAANQLTLYAADSERQNVRAYEVAPDGALIRGRVVADLKHQQPGGPDGLKTDENGTLYVTGHGGVWVFNDGRHIGTIETPEKPANLAWGDDYRTLYITARTSIYRVRVRAGGTRTF